VYFPRLRVRRPSGERDLPAGGAVAGILTRTDTERGVWVSPDGERVVGTLGPAVELDDASVDSLGLAAVNAIRFVPGRGIRLWGARTLADTDAEWKYVHVRRLAAFLEQSIQQGLQWVVFEPNAPRLWTQVRALVRTFLTSVFRSGAFPAATADEAFFVRCDRTTMTQDDVDAGRLVVHVGFAPLRPAEFVILRIGLSARPRSDE
jgi:phage tail sheath protein FI